MVLPFLIPGAIALVKEFAPSLIRSLAGDNAGDIAEKVVNLGAELTGETDTAKAALALRNNPELAVQFQTRMAEIELEYAKLDLKNTQGARARDVALHKVGYKNTRADLMIAVAFISLCFVTWLIYQGRLDIPDGILAIFNMMVGMLLKMLSDAFNFEFGSSRGSKEKSIKHGEHS